MEGSEGRSPYSITFKYRTEKSKSINRENATPLKAFNENELKLLDELASRQRLVITPYGSTYLTELGREIAEGAVKLYRS